MESIFLFTQGLKSGLRNPSRLLTTLDTFNQFLSIAGLDFVLFELLLCILEDVGPLASVVVEKPVSALIGLGWWRWTLSHYGNGNQVNLSSFVGSLDWLSCLVSAEHSLSARSSITGGAVKQLYRADTLDCSVSSTAGGVIAVKS